MAKQVAKVKDIRIVNASEYFPSQKLGFVLTATLVQDTEGRAWPDGTPIRTSMLVAADFTLGIFETLNTIYQQVS